MLYNCTTFAQNDNETHSNMQYKNKTNESIIRKTAMAAAYLHASRK